MSVHRIRTLAATLLLGAGAVIAPTPAAAVPLPGCARQLSVAPVRAFEGTPVPRHSAYTPFSFSVTTTVVSRVGAPPCPVAALTVNVATAHTTTDGADLLAVSKQLSWAQGDVSARTVVVSVRKDSSVECDETFALRVTATSATHPLLASAKGTIANDDHVIVFGGSAPDRGWHCTG